MIEMQARTAREIQAKQVLIRATELQISKERGQMLKRQRLTTFNITETEARLDELEDYVESLREERNALQKVYDLQCVVIAAGAVA